MASYRRRSRTVSMANIELLLRAAELLEKRDAELGDHGYASSKTMYSGGSGSGRQQRKSSVKASLAWNRGHHGGRSLHNEMEKNRRANLRHCFERLKNAIPDSRGESSKNTTLQLLKRAKQWIMNLEQDQAKYEKMKADLIRQRAELSRMASGCSSSEHDELGDEDSDDGGRCSAGSSVFDAQLSYLRPNYHAYRYRADSDSTSPSSVSSNDGLTSETSDDIDIMGTSSDTDEYGQ